MKQRNPKSVNLQFNNCKKVEISQLSASESAPKTQLNEVFSQCADQMLTVIFETTKSKNSQSAEAIAVDLLGGQNVNSMVYVNIPDSKVLEKAKTIKLLCKFTHGMKNITSFFRNRPINLYQFTRKIIDVQTCSLGYSTDINACYIKGKDNGWGCRFLNTIKKNLLRDVVRNPKNTYWYNFGNFNESGEWKVDKDLIKTVIFNQAEGEGINLCPKFSTENILDQILKLPDIIEVDNIHFRNTYRKDFIGNTFSVIPENIVHIPEMSKQEKLEYEKSLKIKELEYQIGMGLLVGGDLGEAKEKLLVLKGLVESYAQKFHMDLNPEAGYRYSDN